MYLEKAPWCDNSDDATFCSAKSGRTTCLICLACVCILFCTVLKEHYHTVQ